MILFFKTQNEHVIATEINHQPNQQEAKEAVAAGYWNLYHYNPDLKKEGKNPFVLDSKEPTLNLRDFLMGEVRFSALTRTFPEEAEKLLAEAELDAKEKYQEYKKLAEG